MSNTKRLLALLLAVCLTLAFLPAAVLAQNAGDVCVAESGQPQTASASDILSPTDTFSEPASPTEIKLAAASHDFGDGRGPVPATVIDSGSELNTMLAADPDGDFILGGDITFTEEDPSYNIMPIGYHDDGSGGAQWREFTGAFDGCGFAINVNMTWGSNQTAPVSLEQMGLFHTIGAGGLVQNFTLAGEVENWHGHAGGVCGINRGTVKNVTSSCDSESVEGHYYSGGIAAENYGTITGCTLQHQDDNVIGTYAYTGGIAGYLGGGRIENCISHVDVKGNDCVGGIAAVADGNGVIASCTNEGKVTIGFYANSVGCGGIVGNSRGSSRMENCVNRGTVSGSSGSGANTTGGIVGKMDNDSTAIGCDNYGQVLARGNTYGDDVGGIAGYVSGSDNYGCVVQECENYGSVSGRNNVGGIVGNNNCCTMFVKNHGEVSGNDNVGGGVGNVGHFGSAGFITNYGAVTGHDIVGGVVGISTAGNSNFKDLDYGLPHSLHYGANYGTITGHDIVGGCIGESESVNGMMNSGNVSGNLNVGGIVGDTNHGSLYDSGNIGNVSGNDNVGGLAGYIYNSTHTGSAHAAAAYSSGSVTGNSDAGALVGFASKGSIYYDYEYLVYDTYRTSLQPFGSGDLGSHANHVEGLSTGAMVANGLAGKIGDYWIYKDTEVLDGGNTIIGYFPVIKDTRKEKAGAPYAPCPEEYRLQNPEVRLHDFESVAIHGSETFDPFTYISSVDELLAIDDTAASRAANYVLNCDIDMAGRTFTTPPISAFSGKLDGMGHTIIGLSGTSGLIDEFSGEIMNLTISGSIDSMSAERLYTGAFANHAAAGTVFYRCENKASTKGYALTGGFAGFAEGSFIECVNRGAIECAGIHIQGHEEAAGGFAGKLLVNGATLTKLENYGSVTTTNSPSPTGGIAGYAGSTNSSTRITDSVNAGDIASSYCIGGFIGRNDGISLTGCANYGNISFNSDHIYSYSLGGLIGQCEHKRNVTVTLDTCINMGNVTAPVSGQKQIGGLVGYVEYDSRIGGTPFAMVDCVNAGEPYDKAYEAAALFCGEPGLSYSATRCYFDEELRSVDVYIGDDMPDVGVGLRVEEFANPTDTETAGNKFVVSDPSKWVGSEPAGRESTSLVATSGLVLNYTCQKWKCAALSAFPESADLTRTTIDVQKLDFANPGETNRFVQEKEYTASSVMFDVTLPGNPDYEAMYRERGSSGFTRTMPKNVGTYDVKLDFTTKYYDTPNFNTSPYSTLIINNCKITLKIDDQRIQTGESEPEYTCTVTGLGKWDDFSQARLDIGVSDPLARYKIGEYVIDLATATNIGPYDITSYTKGTLTVWQDSADDKFTLMGETGVGHPDWYVSPVTIAPKLNNAAGLDLISDDGGVTWHDKLVYSSDSVPQIMTLTDIRLKNSSTGAFTAKASATTFGIFTKPLKLELSTPTNGEQYHDPSKNVLTFTLNQTAVPGRGYITVVDDSGQEFARLNVNSPRVRLAADGRTVSVHLPEAFTPYGRYTVIAGGGTFCSRDYGRPFDGIIAGEWTFTVAGSSDSVDIVGVTLEASGEAESRQAMYVGRDEAEYAAVLASDITSGTCSVTITPQVNGVLANDRIALRVVSATATDAFVQTPTDLVTVSGQDVIFADGVKSAIIEVTAYGQKASDKTTLMLTPTGWGAARLVNNTGFDIKTSSIMSAINPYGIEVANDRIAIATLTVDELSEAQLGTDVLAQLQEQAAGSTIGRYLTLSLQVDIYRRDNMTTSLSSIPIDVSEEHIVFAIQFPDDGLEHTNERMLRTSGADTDELRVVTGENGRLLFASDTFNTQDAPGVCAYTYDILYKITVEPSTGVAVTPDRQSAIAGDTVTLTVTPGAGCYLSQLFVNGVAISGRTFVMPAEDVTVSATYGIYPSPDDDDDGGKSKDSEADDTPDDTPDDPSAAPAEDIPAGPDGRQPAPAGTEDQSGDNASGQGDVNAADGSGVPAAAASESTLPVWAWVSIVGGVVVLAGAAAAIILSARGKRPGKR